MDPEAAEKRSAVSLAFASQLQTSAVKYKDQKALKAGGWVNLLHFWKKCLLIVRPWKKATPKD